jgi:hypothetical protein
MFPVNLNGLCIQEYLNPVTAEKALRGLKKQFAPFFNGSGNVVGKSAVCKGHIGSPFKEYDFCGFIESADPGCCGGPRGNTAYYHYLFGPFWHDFLQIKYLNPNISKSIYIVNTIILLLI